MPPPALSACSFVCPPVTDEATSIPNKPVRRGRDLDGIFLLFFGYEERCTSEEIRRIARPTSIKHSVLKKTYSIPLTHQEDARY